MGFFGSLAKKVGGAVSTLGQKVAGGVRAGVKYGITHSEKIAQVAGKVEGIANQVGEGAGAVKGVANKVTEAKATAKRFGIDANAMANNIL